MVILPPPDGVEDEADYDAAAEDERRPVHGDERDGHDGREEGEDDGDNEEAHGEDVDDEACGSKGPGTPDDGGWLPGTLDGEESDRDEVGGV